jgi:hypothetical protein
MLLILGFLACQQAQKPEHGAKPSVPESQFQQALSLGEVHALANGTAYVSSLLGGVFYVTGGVAERVKGLPPKSGGDLTPLADGSALLATRFTKPAGLYWLRGVEATVVTEGTTIGREVVLPATQEGFLFAENQHLKRKLADTVSELAARDESDEAIDDAPEHGDGW